MVDLDYSLYYRRFHDDSDESARHAINECRDLLAPYLPSPEGRNALDIGCGMGFGLMYLQECGFKDIWGIDVDASQIAACRRRNLPAERVADTAAYLAVRPETFDLVLMLDVLEHVPVGEQVGLMRGVYGSLRPGGIVILRAPNANSPIAAVFRYGDFTHHSAFTEYSIDFVCRNAGFGRIDVPPLGQPFGEWRRHLRVWRHQHRVALRAYVIRWMWRQVLAAEIGDSQPAWSKPLTPNLLAVARK